MTRTYHSLLLLLLGTSVWGFSPCTAMESDCKAESSAPRSSSRSLKVDLAQPGDTLNDIDLKTISNLELQNVTSRNFKLIEFPLTSATREGNLQSITYSYDPKTKRFPKFIDRFFWEVAGTGKIALERKGMKTFPEELALNRQSLPLERSEERLEGLSNYEVALREKRNTFFKQHVDVENVAVAAQKFSLDAVLAPPAGEIDPYRTAQDIMSGNGKDLFLDYVIDAYDGDLEAFRNVIMGIKTGAVGAHSVDRNDDNKAGAIVYTLAHQLGRARYESIQSSKLLKDEAFQEAIRELVFCYGMGVGTQRNGDVARFLKQYLPPQEELEQED